MMEDGSALTPNFWRAPTDNDFGAGLQHKYAAWKNPELKLTSLKHAIENDQAVVRAEYDMKSIGGTLSLTYTINNKGAVKVTQRWWQTRVRRFLKCSASVCKCVCLSTSTR